MYSVLRKETNLCIDEKRTGILIIGGVMDGKAKTKTLCFSRTFNMQL